MTLAENPVLARERGEREAYEQHQREVTARKEWPVDYHQFQILDEHRPIFVKARDGYQAAQDAATHGVLAAIQALHRGAEWSRLSGEAQSQDEENARIRVLAGAEKLILDTRAGLVQFSLELWDLRDPSSVQEPPPTSELGRIAVAVEGLERRAVVEDRAADLVQRLGRVSQNELQPRLVNELADAHQGSDNLARADSILRAAAELSRRYPGRINLTLLRSDHDRLQVGAVSPEETARLKRIEMNLYGLRHMFVHFDIKACGTLARAGGTTLDPAPVTVAQQRPATPTPKRAPEVDERIGRLEAEYSAIKYNDDGTSSLRRIAISNELKALRSG